MRWLKLNSHFRYVNKLYLRFAVVPFFYFDNKKNYSIKNDICIFTLQQSEFTVLRFRILTAANWNCCGELTFFF